MKKRYFWTLAALIASLLVASTWLAASASAHPLVGVAAAPAAPQQVNPLWTDFNISNDATHTENFPEIAANSVNGSYFITWKYEDAGGGSKIAGQLVNALGDVLTQTLIGATGSDSNLVPWADVAFNETAGNQYMVVWNAIQTEPFSDLYGQRVAANAELVSGTFRIDEYDDHYDYYPTIVQDTTHGPFLVVWNERWTEFMQPSEAQISGRLLGGDGAPLTSTFKIGDLSDYDVAQSAAAFNSTDDEYLVVWDEWYGGSDVITGQIVLHDGALSGAPFHVGELSGLASVDTTFLDVAYDSGRNQYLVVWCDMDNGNSNIYGQLVAADGALNGGRFAIASDSRPQYQPAVSYYESQNFHAFLVVWYSQQPVPQNDDIYGAWVSVNGPVNGDAVLGNALPFKTDDDNWSQRQPAVAFNTFSNQFLVAWQEHTTIVDIYGMRVSGLPYDLSVNNADFWTTPLIIHEGDDVALSAGVTNLFGQALSDVEVAFYNGDPAAGGDLIVSKAIDFALGDHSETVTATWNIAGLSGLQTLYVVVDPDNAIPEMLETNNQVSEQRNIRPVSTDTQPPTGTLTINGGDNETNDAQLTLTIEAFDDNPLGVRWMFLREWWPVADIPLGDEVSTPGIHGYWAHRNSGWMRYDPSYATDGYPYIPIGAPGVKYIQVWLRDAAGNVSETPPPIWDSINYVPNFPWTLVPGEWHLYRGGWEPSTLVTVTMDVMGDDDGLYIWSPGSVGGPSFTSDLPGGVDHTEVITFTAIAGEYDILASGQFPYGGQYQITWRPEMSDDPLVVAASRPAGVSAIEPPIPPGSTPPTISGIPEFVEAADTNFVTGWVDIAPGETLTFTHSVGGDPDFYTVELWFLDEDAGGAGINHVAYGGDRFGTNVYGAYWWDLTDTTIKVTRGSSDTTADQVRLRIFQADPPDYDSGWTPIQPGEANLLTLAHNLGGVADDYLVGIKFRDVRLDGLGLHQYAFGGLDTGGAWEGAAWLNLTSASVQVVRFAGDLASGEFRLMIYLPDPASPPNYDSGWQTVNAGNQRTLTHNLGGNPAAYVVRATNRSTAFGINSIAGGGLTLNNGTHRGSYWQNLTGASLTVLRTTQDIYSQEVRVRIWLPTNTVYLPIVMRDTAPQQEVAYDDGEMDSDQSADQGSGFAVRFTANGTAHLDGAKFYLNSAAGTHPIEIHVWDVNHADLMTPLVVTPTAGIGWLSVDLSSSGLALSGDFYVGFLYPEGSYDPSLGMDTDAPLDGRSYEVPWMLITNDYMIRIIVH